MYDDQNVFAKILRGEIPNDTVFEDDEVLAFKDIAPQAPVHILVIPKVPVETVKELPADVAGKLIETAKNIAAEQGLVGYKLQFNVGPEGGQVVPHVHLHILGGWGHNAGEETAV